MTNKSIERKTFNYDVNSVIQYSLSCFDQEILESGIDKSILKESGLRVANLYMFEEDFLLHVGAFEEELEKLLLIYPNNKKEYIEIILIASWVAGFLESSCPNINSKKLLISNILSQYVGMAKGNRNSFEEKEKLSEFYNLAIAKRNLAQQGANAKNKETNECKADVFKWADENMDSLKSMDEAADVLTDMKPKLVPYTRRTVRKWLTEWKKLRSAGTA